MAPSVSHRLRAVAPGWWILVGSVTLVALHLWIARGVTGPVILHDEMGYLGNARWLAGVQPVPDMGDAAFYTWGYSVLIAPLTVVIDDPGLLHRAVQVLNSVLLASLFPLLWLLVGRLTSLSRHGALIPAAVGSLFPATLVHSSMAWTESLLPPLLVLLILSLGWALDPHRPGWQRWSVAPVVVALYATHGRMLPALGLVAVGLVLGAATRRIPTPVAAAGVVTMAAGWLVVGRVNSALADARWPERMTTEGSAPRLLRRLLNPRTWPGLVGESVGEAWYLSVGSFGLAAIGALAVLWHLRHWQPQAGLASDTDRNHLVVIGGALILAALFVTSAVSFVGTAERVDQLFYGRYNEAFAPLLVAAGVAALMAFDPSRRRQVIGASALLTVVLGATLWLGRGPDAFDGEIVWPMILAVRLFADIGGQEAVVPVATAASVLAAAVMWVLGRRRVLAAGAVAVAMVVSATAAVGPLSDYADVLYDGWELPDHLARVTEAAGVDHVTVSRLSPSYMTLLVYPYWNPAIDHRLGPFEQPTTTSGLVVAHVTNGPPNARIALLDGRHQLAVWAVPGPDPSFEALEERGVLLPPGFPATLPDSARQAQIDLVGESAPTSFPSGATTNVQVRVHHAGTDGSWPSDAEWPLPGVVRVGARWFDEQDNEVQASDWGGLSAPMWPGDTQVVDLDLRALDQAGRPLAPGRYRVEVNLLQADLAWFPDVDALHLQIEIT